MRTSTPRLPLLLLAASALSLLSAAPAAAQSVCTGITLTGARGPYVFTDGFESGDTAAWSAPAVLAYSTTATVDLGAEVELASPPQGEHQLELRWFLPGGTLYQSITLPFAASAAPGAVRRVAGYPLPVALRPVRQSTGEAGEVVPAVAASLAVAGTSITETGLWGAWRVEAYLDGAATPCAASEFRLEP